MYSLVLMMAMTTPADIPQGIIFYRGTGCNGAQVQASTGCAGVKVAPTGCAGVSAAQVVKVKQVVRQIVHSQPVRTRLLGRVFQPNSTGCVGTCGVTVSVQSTGCAGSNFGYTRMPSTPTVTAVAAPAPQAVGAVFRDHRIIKRFLAKHGVPQAQLDGIDAKFGASPIWGQLLQIFIEQGLPMLLEYLKNLLAR